MISLPVRVAQGQHELISGPVLNGFSTAQEHVILVWFGKSISALPFVAGGDLHGTSFGGYSESRLQLEWGGIHVVHSRRVSESNLIQSSASNGYNSFGEQLCFVFCLNGR